MGSRQKGSPQDPPVWRSNRIGIQEETVANQSSAWTTQQHFASPTGRRAPGRRSAWRRAVALIGMALVALLPLTPSALAAGTLTITTPYPAITVAPGAKVSMDLTIKTSDLQQVALSVAGTPADWQASLHGGGYIVNSVQTEVPAPLSNGALQAPQASARLDVTIPAKAANGTTKMSVTASAAGQTASVAIEITVSSTAAGNVTLTTDITDRKGPSSSSYVYNLTLSNDSASDITFTASATGPTGWTIDATIGGQAQIASAIVKASASNGITITIRPSSTATAGQYAVDVSVQAGTQTLTQKLNIEITGSYSATLTTPDSVLTNHGNAGGNINQSLVIGNTGTAELKNVTVNFTAPSGWKVTFDPAIVPTIAPNTTQTIVAKIVPDPDAIAGDYLVTFRSVNDQITASQDIRITVETSPLWGIVGVALIVAVAAGLWWVFQRYGRR